MKGRSLLSETIAWVVRRDQIPVGILLVVVIASAIAVVYSAHVTRQLYSERQSLQKEQDNLDNEYEKLLLEQSAWADYARVDQLARQELDMKQPGASDLVIVRQ